MSRYYPVDGRLDGGILFSCLFSFTYPSSTSFVLDLNNVCMHMSQGRCWIEHDLLISTVHVGTVSSIERLNPDQRHVNVIDPKFNFPSGFDGKPNHQHDVYTAGNLQCLLSILLLHRLDALML